MALKVGINGFGRIGRLVFRAGIKNPNIEFVGINDLVQPEYLAYLLKYDSTPRQVRRHRSRTTPTASSSTGKKIPCVSVRSPADLPWAKTGGGPTSSSRPACSPTSAGAEGHLKAGAKRVVISAPTKDPEKVPTLLMGVNEGKFDPAKDTVVSNASAARPTASPRWPR